MSDTPEPGTPDASEIHSRLQDAVWMVRDSRSLEPEVRGALAELLDELGRAVEGASATPAEVAHLAESAAHLTEALHHARHDRGLLERARGRLGEVLVRAESHAPIAVGLARRLIDALAAMGV